MMNNYIAGMIYGIAVTNRSKITVDNPRKRHSNSLAVLQKAGVAVPKAPKKDSHSYTKSISFLLFTLH